MCLAVPAKVDEKQGDDAWVTLGDARIRVNLCLTPEADVGDWVLVHAGFAIERVDEQTALETWQLFQQMEQDTPALDEGGAP